MRKGLCYCPHSRNRIPSLYLLTGAIYELEYTQTGSSRQLDGYRESDQNDVKAMPERNTPIVNHGSCLCCAPASVDQNSTDALPSRKKKTALRNKSVSSILASVSRLFLGGRDRLEYSRGAVARVVLFQRGRDAAIMPIVYRLFN